MTDLEMTKLCAEAMNMPVELAEVAPQGTAFGMFNPLYSDAQAMSLVKQFGLTIDPQEDKPPFTWRVVVAPSGDWDNQIFSQGTDLNRAIVECVAKLQAVR